MTKWIAKTFAAAAIGLPFLLLVDVWQGVSHSSVETRSTLASASR
jgi:hypothetical protein